jgi:hypothetical protein
MKTNTEQHQQIEAMIERINRHHSAKTKLQLSRRNDAYAIDMDDGAVTLACGMSLSSVWYYVSGMDVALFGKVCVLLGDS